MEIELLGFIFDPDLSAIKRVSQQSPVIYWIRFLKSKTYELSLLMKFSKFLKMICSSRFRIKISLFFILNERSK